MNLPVIFTLFEIVARVKDSYIIIETGINIAFSRNKCSIVSVTMWRINSFDNKFSIELLRIANSLSTAHVHINLKHRKMYRN